MLFQPLIVSRYLELTGGFHRQDPFFSPGLTVKIIPSLRDELAWKPLAPAHKS
jgi:hypothetical protein